MVFINFPLYSATGGSGFAVIDQLRFGGGFARVTGMSDFTDPSDCNQSGLNSSREMIIIESTSSYKEIESTLLMAKASNTAVQFWVNGCHTDSGYEYPKGLYIYLK